MKTPAEETIKKGRPRKKPKTLPIKTSRSIKKNSSPLKLKGAVIVTRSLGRTMAISERASPSFTGAGRMRAPKKGERPMIGPILPRIKKQSDRTERVPFSPEEFFKNNCK
jgi:hypothetical protein